MDDSRNPQIKFETENFYVAFLQPKKEAFANVEGDALIDAILPKINAGYYFKMDNMTLHPTIGFNYSKYNKNFNEAEFDEAIMCFVGAVTLNYKMDQMKILAQLNYGINAANYGMIFHDNAYGAYYDGKDVQDATTLGGFGQFTYQQMNFGLGYTQTEIEGLDDPDAAMSIFGNYIYKLNEKLKVVPEIGMIDYMEDGFGNKQGNFIYFGGKIQADF